jgi:hypothetical protein
VINKTHAMTHPFMAAEETLPSYFDTLPATQPPPLTRTASEGCLEAIRLVRTFSTAPAHERTGMQTTMTRLWHILSSEEREIVAAAIDDSSKAWMPRKHMSASE